mmetsp:Transcript_6848/g.12197  ORF Transcript_6848/g.12197 Transcript_6848/m.12197 type:complete len:212 (+) Transcript_6848:94-729(+)
MAATCSLRFRGEPSPSNPGTLRGWPPIFSRTTTPMPKWKKNPKKNGSRRNARGSKRFWKSCVRRIRRRPRRKGRRSDGGGRRGRIRRTTTRRARRVERAMTHKLREVEKGAAAIVCWRAWRPRRWSGALPGARDVATRTPTTAKMPMRPMRTRRRNDPPTKWPKNENDSIASWKRANFVPTGHSTNRRLPNHYRRRKSKKRRRRKKRTTPF